MSDNRIMRPWVPACIGAGLAAAFMFAVPAAAQELSDADHELCSVYDRNDRFVGYDSVCLERKRAQIRRYKHSGRHHGHGAAGYPAFTGIYFCPVTANFGAGYNATFYNDGRPPQYFGKFDATLNGQPCRPRYVGPRGTGYN
ncbi:hypothetical protein [Pseudokordiimonas caeni]|uniref:hypothetical protein n=1 Tax=Pseudokordiimonas caeni TaxID=2997908 RepID=UPI00281243B4|nr:hypothetical protein [Pseudokordiimonas caeni]